MFIYNREKKIPPESNRERRRIRMSDKYLSEVIDYEKDIEPYQIIQIYSGVGSGKNHWVETLAEQGHNILLITSRKATADSQAKKLDGQRWIPLEDLTRRDFRINNQQKVVVTNAGIEQFLKKNYIPEDKKTHIWRYFDFVILDEAHSLVSDATFSDSPFHVKSFFKGIYESNSKCKTIFMTGTPEPIKGVFSDETKKSPRYNYLDLYRQCKHVDPELVSLYPGHGISKAIVELVKSGNRLIYFANSIKRIEELVNSFLKLGIEEKCIGIAYSGEDPRSFSKTLMKQKREIREALLREEKIPKEIKIFVTTSQNKEGININDDDIKIMISECLEKSSLIQMAGRVRKGLEELVILYNAKQHETRNTEAVMKLDHYCLAQVQRFWNDYGYNCKENSDIIEMIEDKFPNIRYDYIFEKFRFYSERVMGYHQRESDAIELKDDVYYWNVTRYREDELSGITVETGWLCFQEWFPFSEVYCATEMSVEEQMAMLEKGLNELLRSGNYIDRLLSKADKAQLIEKINGLLKDKGYHYSKMGLRPEIKQLNPFLSKFGYEIIDAPGRRKGNFFVLQHKHTEEN